MPTHMHTHTHTHLKNNLPYLIISQLWTIPSCVDKTKVSKTNPWIKVKASPSPIARREEAMEKGKDLKEKGKKSSL